MTAIEVELMEYRHTAEDPADESHCGPGFVYLVMGLQICAKHGLKVKSYERLKEEAEAMAP